MPETEIPRNDARRLASGVLRLRPTLTWPSMTTQEIPGMSPRAMAVSASPAIEADGASHTTRSAGAPTAIVPVPAARRKACVLLPVARAITTSGGRRPRDASRPTLFMTPMGIPPVPVEAVLRVAHAVPGHLGEVVVGEAGLEHHGARDNLHPVGMKVLEALRGRDRDGVGGRRIVRPARCVHALARRHHRRDAAVH